MITAQRRAAARRLGPIGLIGLALVAGAAGCGGRAASPASRPTHAELVLISRGSLRGQLVPTG